MGETGDRLIETAGLLLSHLDEHTTVDVSRSEHIQHAYTVYVLAPGYRVVCILRKPSAREASNV